MKYIGICILALLTGLVDMPRLMRRRRKRELIVAGALLLVGFVFAEVWAAQLPLPTIGAALRALAKPFLGE
jgi:hypothetical protein